MEKALTHPGLPRPTRKRGEVRLDLYKPPTTAYGRQVEECKRHIISGVLQAHHGNRTHAARALGLQRTYLLRLMRQYGLKAAIPPSQNGRRSGTQ